jgi:hypothetical protein
MKRTLIEKLLELDEPNLSPKMTDFMSLDSVMNILLSYVTRMSDAGKRPDVSKEVSEELKTSYKATILITADESLEATSAFIGDHVPDILSSLVEIFRDESSGCLQHARAIFETLMVCFPSEMLQWLSSEGRVQEILLLLCRFVGYPSVSNIFLALLCPQANTDGDARFQKQTRVIYETYWVQLREWRPLHRLSSLLSSIDDTCRCDEVTPQEHACAIASLLHELIDRLSIEDPAKLLHGHVADNFGLVGKLVSLAVTPSTSLSLRGVCLKCLNFILARSSEPQLYTSCGGMVPTAIVNHLYLCREHLLQAFHLEFSSITDALVALRKEEASEEGAKLFPAVPLTHPGHSVVAPFSTARLTLIELIQLLVAADAELTAHLSVGFWEEMIRMLKAYPHNNIFHALFYRLFFVALRQGSSDAVFRLLFDASFLQFLVENHTDAPRGPVPDAKESDPSESATPDSNADADADASLADAPAHRCVKPPIELIRMRALHGLVLDVANAVRLHAELLTVDDPLKVFLANDKRWATFMPVLRASTLECFGRPGLGIVVAQRMKGGPSSSMGLGAHSNEETDEDAQLCHGSRLAIRLGFAPELSDVSESRSSLFTSFDRDGEEDDDEFGGDDDDDDDDDDDNNDEDNEISPLDRRRDYESEGGSETPSDDDADLFLDKNAFGDKASMEGLSKTEQALLKASAHGRLSM